MRNTARIVRLLVLIALLVMPTTAFASKSHRTTLAKLQAQLNEATEDDGPIVLTLGSDFLKPPGTVIFLSRERGAKKLIEMARANKPELSVIFLPGWEVWITQTTARYSGDMEINHLYLEAALLAGLRVEYWHTHNNATSEQLTDEELPQRSIQWTMPSPIDMLQFYDYYNEIPGAHLQGVIASTHGITTYENNDPSWAAPTYVGSAVQSEARQLHQQTSTLTVAELPQFAQSHKGLIHLKFEPYPK